MKTHWLKVMVKGFCYDVPIQVSDKDPTLNKIGPVPPEVLEEYELVALPVQFLLRKDRDKTAESSRD